MFTGLVQGLGTVAEAGGGRLVVETPLTSELRQGDSVAVNGVCLTATGVEDGRFAADVMEETVRRSSLGSLHAGASRCHKAHSAGDARCHVDDGGDPALDQRLGADPVEVDVVEDGDVAGLQPPGEVLGAAVEAGGAGHAGGGVLGPGASQGADAHDRDGPTGLATVDFDARQRPIHHTT